MCWLLMVGGMARAQSASDNFDTDTVGSIAPGWVNASGSAFVVGTSAPVSGTNSFGATSGTDGSIAVYTGVASVADQVAQFNKVVGASGGAISTNLMMRSDSTGSTSGYVFNFAAASGTFAAYVRTGGTIFTALTNTTGIGTIPTYTAGTQITEKAQVQGTTISWKVWVKGAAEPSTWNFQCTDATLTAGYAGIRLATSGAITNRETIDDWSVGPIIGTPSITVSPGSLTAGTTGNNVVLTGTNTSWTSGTTFSVTSTGTGAAIVGSPVINVGAQTATLNVTAGTVGTLTFHDSTDSATITQSVLAAPAIVTASTLFNRQSASPVIAKSATYGGIVADALAAPAVCRNAAGSGWVMLIDIWNVAAGKWYNIAFTSTDLATWTYVASSLQAPTGGDYITGNGGIVYNASAGKYYRSFSHYASASVPSNGIFIASSPDLVTWTNVNAGAAVLTVGASGSGDNQYLCDSSLIYNSNTSQYELWYAGADTTISGRSIMYATSTDCVTWTKTGTIEFGAQTWNSANLGEPQAFYVGTTRYVSFDSGSVAGVRSIGLAIKKAGSTYALTPNVLIPEFGNAWETTNVFDSCCVGAIDRGDGRGLQLWMLYAGSPIVASTDATQSGIGLAYAPLPSTTTNIFNVFQPRRSR